MSNVNASELTLFEQASRAGITFSTPKGENSMRVDDLWKLDLSSTNKDKVTLDSLARGLSRQLKETAQESYVDAPTAVNAELQLKFDVVLRVIAIKKAENAAHLSQRELAQRKEALRAQILKKEEEEGAARPLAELKAEYDELNRLG